MRKESISRKTSRPYYEERKGERLGEKEWGQGKGGETGKKRKRRGCFCAPASVNDPSCENASFSLLVRREKF